MRNRLYEFGNEFGLQGSNQRIARYEMGMVRKDQHDVRSLHP